MIARMWHGRVPREKGDAYVRFLRERAIPDYRSITGNLGAYVLRSDERPGETRVITLSFWNCLDSIVAFAGSDYRKAKYYPEDGDYLLEFPEHVEHFELYDSAQ